MAVDRMAAMPAGKRALAAALGPVPAVGCSYSEAARISGRLKRQHGPWTRSNALASRRASDESMRSDWRQREQVDIVSGACAVRAHESRASNGTVTTRRRLERGRSALATSQGRGSQRDCTARAREGELRSFGNSRHGPAQLREREHWKIYSVDGQTRDSPARSSALRE